MVKENPGFEKSLILPPRNVKLVMFLLTEKKMSEYRRREDD